MELNIDNQKTKQNIFLFPAILCVIQFVFVFVVLFKSGLSFAPVALAVDAVLMLMWCGLFVQRHIRNKVYAFSLKGLFLFICFVLASFIIIRKSWFGQYLRIDSIVAFFKGETFIDPLYHSAIAESYITNGYSSIQINAPSFIAYHSLSHAMVAGLSKILSIPCFITYNYVYPVIALPLFVYLFQKVILVAKFFFKKDKALHFSDLILIIFFMIWENHFTNYRAGLYIDAWAYGESYCVSVILLFLYICIIDVGYKKIRSFDFINLCFLIPLFILLLSFCKISTGCMFFVGVSYYIFRKNLFKNKKWVFAFVYLLVFMLYYFLPGKFCPAPTYSISKESSGSFELFHYVHNNTENVFFAIIHYILCFLPTVLILLVERPKKLFFKIRNIPDKNAVFETLVLTVLVSCLPGLIMVIDGGSALYFEAPAWTMSFIMLLALEVPNRLKTKMSEIRFRLFFKSMSMLKLVSCLFIVFGLGVLSLGIYDSDICGMLKTSFDCRLSMSSIAQNEDYKLFTQVREATKQHRSEYCLFLKDDVNIIFEYGENDGYEGINLIKPYLAVSAYTGIPVINAMYYSGNQFYRGDGFAFGQYSDFAGYSLPPAFCNGKVTLANMNDIAKMLGKKYTVVLAKDGFEVVDVD